MPPGDSGDKTAASGLDEWLLAEWDQAAQWFAKVRVRK
jgi:hypothetical protein